MKCLTHNFWSLLIKEYCVKGVRIRSYSGVHFPVFGLNMERSGESLRIQSECQKIQTRITTNADTFYAVKAMFLDNNMTHCWKRTFQKMFLKETE